MTKPTIPPQVMDDPDFIDALRTSYLHQEPTARRLLIAVGLADDLGRTYLDQALSVSREAIREILLGKFNYQPEEPEEGEEPEPDYRAPAASLFLYGMNAGYWTATADETELARALVIAVHGMEALEMLKPEKTKDDLAREAGVPNVTFVHKSPQDGRTAKRIVDDYLDDYLYVQKLSDEAELIAARKPRDIDAIGEAFGDYLAALKRYFPKAYEAQVARLRKQFAPAIAAAYVDMTKE